MKAMLNWLKIHFIPHLANGHRPHFLLAASVRQLLSVVIGIELLLFIAPTLNFVTIVDNFNLGAVLPGVLSTLTNEERQANQLPELAVNPLLSKSAQLKAEDMATKSYFAHTSPEGLTPWHWFKQVGYLYSYAGENLAVNFTDSEDVTRAWMNSPTHRANIVGGAYTEMGTGVATGTYKGRGAVFVAQVYASPARGRLGAAVSDAIPVNVFQRALSSPHQTTTVVFSVLLFIIFIAILLNLSTKHGRKHKDLMANGLALIAIILAVNLANAYIVRENFETSFIAFDAPQTSDVVE